MSGATKRFVHVGCGMKRKNMTTPGFNTSEWDEIRFDIDEQVKPDIVGTMLDMSAIADGSVDAVFSSHNIEHLYPHEVPKAISEFRRILRPDGFVVITCPDLQSVAALIAEDKLLEPAYVSPAGPIAPLDILYGFRRSIAAGNTFMAHRCGFTRRVLSDVMEQSGFARVATLARAHPSFDLWCVATRQALDDEALSNLARQHFPIKG